MNQTMTADLSRRGLLGSGVAGAALALVTGPATATPPLPVKFRNGLSLSRYPEAMFDKNVAYRAGKRTARSPEELQRVYMDHGSTEVFVRAGTSRTAPYGGRNSGFSEVVPRARLARALGLPLNPELLLCGIYGDMGGQPEPDFSGFPQITLRKPWIELGIDEMCDAMRIYGELAAKEILNTGVTVNVWDLGNEVEFGIAGVAIPPMTKTIGGPGWTYRAPDAVDPEIGKMTIGKFFMMKPADQAAWGKAHLWGHVGKILAAVADGIRKADPKARFATHTSAIATMIPQVFVGFYETLDANGFRSEELGASYYPTNTKLIPKRLDLFKETARLAKDRLGRPIYIAEFGYAAGPVIYGGDDWANPVEGYPITPDGQARFLRDLVEWGVREGTVCGVRPWAPDYVGGSWQGMALFEAPVNGVAVARPGLSSIREGLALAAQPRKA